MYLKFYRLLVKSLLLFALLWIPFTLGLIAVMITDYLGVHWASAAAEYGIALFVEIFCPIAFGLLLLVRFLPKPRIQETGFVCRTCGYDLRAHAPGGICPECGTVIPP